MTAIVGIGASAGGLDVFKRFFQRMPADSGMVFVLTQHLDPTHESLTAELVGRYTAMPVVQVQQDTPPQRDHVYVMPPGKYLTIGAGVLRVTEFPEPRGIRMPIDLFLRSLAEDQQERAIAIILSGTGTDGALGVKEIKAAGGMTMAQDPETTQYDGMVRSAIATGSVDCVARVEAMPDILLKYVRHPYLQSVATPEVEPRRVHDDLAPIIAVLRARAKFDFSCYKKGTLRRRVQRRMGLKHLEKPADYLQVLRDDPAEVTALFKDLLIGVTSFFREPEAWNFLRQRVIPGLVEEKSPGSALRVWVPACASGEEAYSVAMLFIERLQETQKTCSLQIFASDVDREALETGRTGIYPESIAADASPERLRRFFIRGDQTYRVNKELRDTVIFAHQNLLNDPPFSKLDMISCRNLLIYLEPAVQKRLIALLHFALNDGGYLFLGTAESIGGHEDLFETVSRKWRIYRRIGPTRRDKAQFPVLALPATRHEIGPTAVAQPYLGRLGNLAQQLVLDRYAPACVVVNRKYEILYFFGPTHDYLMQPTGLPTQDVIAKARNGLQSVVRRAVHRAIHDNTPVTVGGATVKQGRLLRRVRVTVEPLRAPKEMQGLLLVSFADEGNGTGVAAAKEARHKELPSHPTTAAEESLVHQLEYELKSTREDLQSTIEELESANEELKAANEEVMSVNEELQSTNEELETSKEELQSLNEELSTVNSQLEGKVVELESANNDLSNLLSSTDIATLFLDTHFCIRRFTPAATTLFSLIPSDVGRPISDITQKFNDPDLLPDAREVLDRLMPLQKQVASQEGRWYVRQVLPYRTQDNRIEGVVVTFSGVVAEALQDARQYAESIVETVPTPLIVLDRDLRIRAANRAFCETMGVSAPAVEGALLHEISDRAWDVPGLRDLLTRVLPEGRPFAGFEIDLDLAGSGRRSMLVNARPLSHKGERTELILVAVEDVTERKRNLQALHDSEARMRAILDTAADGIITIDGQGLILSCNRAAEKLFGYTPDEVMGHNVNMLMPSPYHEEHDQYLANYLRTGQPRIIGIGREVTARRKDGTVFPIGLAVSEYRDGQEVRFTGIVRDISTRVEAERQLRRHQAELARVQRLTTMGELAVSLAHELAQPLAAVANEVEAGTAYARAHPVDRARLVDALERAGSEAVRAGQILQRVKEFVQKRELQLERVDLRQVATHALEFCEPEIERLQIALRVQLGAQELPVSIDRIQMEQVLVNLVQNGVDAMRDGARTRTLEVTAVAGADHMAEIAVRDTGAGFSAEALQHLFEPFFTTKPQGLGIGLAISRSIAEAHGGRIVIERPDDRRGGSRVRVLVPLAGQPGDDRVHGK